MKRAALLAGTLTIALSRPPDARACGGNFTKDPAATVLQTGQSIVLAVDRQAGTLQAIFDIKNQGRDAELAWLLPLPAAPDQIGTAPAAIFDAIDFATAPRFLHDTVVEGSCDTGGCSNLPLSGAAQHDPGGVEVLSRQPVGPYDTAVLRATRPEEIQRWLLDHGYVATDHMIAAIAPYVLRGDVILALELTQGADATEITPITLTLTATVASIPIRLAAISAQDDLPITVMLLSDEGIAVPANYDRFTLNLARIDWADGGSNYEALVTEAVQEAGGRAFTTEYAGPASALAGKINRGSNPDPDLLRRAASTSELAAMLETRLPAKSYPELAAILAHSASVAGAVDEIERRILEPEVQIQALFDRKKTLTRLHTRMSPAEMDRDPLFSFDAHQSAVSNEHRASSTQDCGLAGSSKRVALEVTLMEDGRSLRLPRHLPPMPAASIVERFSTGERTIDNRAAIRAALEKSQDDGAGCRCLARPGAVRVAIFWSALILLFGGRRRARKTVAR